MNAKRFTATITAFKKNGPLTNPVDQQTVTGSKTLILDELSELLKNAEKYSNITVTIR